MIFYASLMIFIILLWFALKPFGYKNRLKTYSIAICTILFCIMGFKAVTVGNDTPVYVDLYYQLQDINELFLNPTRYEIGYVIFSKIISRVFANHQALFIIIALIVMYGTNKFIVSNSNKIWLSFYLLVSLRQYYFFMSGLRQTIAVILICISYKYIKERKVFKFILIVLLATTFHNTSIIFMIAYPISYLKFNRTGVISLTTLTALIYLFFDKVMTIIFSLLPSYYSHYQYSAQFSENNVANMVNGLIILAFLVLGVITGFSRNTGRNNGEFSERDTLSYFVFIAFCISIISIRASMLDRVYMYFWIFGVIYIPNVLKNIKNKKLSIFIQYSIIVLTFIYNLAILYMRPEWNHIVPYKFFWQ